MRVASSMTQRNYLKNLERNYSDKWDSEKKINSNRQFQQASECPAQSSSAMRVRKAIANLNNYQDNLETAESVYSNAESSIMAISEVIQTTYEKCIEAANGTKTEDQMEMLAMAIDSYADEICRLMNITVADRKIFGGTNNETNAFAIDNGRVTYNGVDVGTYSDYSMFPNSNPSYCDIGLGMSINEDGVVDEQSALQLTFNGAEMIGCGYASTTAYINNIKDLTDGTSYSFELAMGDKKYNISFTAEDTAEKTIDAINGAIDKELGLNGTGKVKVMEQSGMIANNLNADAVTLTDKSAGDKLSVTNQSSGYSNNVIQNLLDAANCIRTCDGDEIARYADQIYNLQTTVSLALAKIGTTTNFIDFNKTRITNNLENLQSRQNDLEFTDIASESINWKSFSSIYSANLQMTTSVLPQSIFDFMS